MYIFFKLLAALHITQPCTPGVKVGFVGVRVAEWLSHSAVEQEVPGSNPGDAESVGQWWNYL